jgi:Holliday junction resolvase RusA-like endonuclease
MRIKIEMEPFPYVKMTAKGRFNKRAKSYHSKLNELRLKLKLAKLKPTDKLTLTFVLAMPKSWSKKKRLEMDGKPCKKHVDLSNLIKAVEDCIYNGNITDMDDCEIWAYGSMSKVWGQEGKIIFY